VVIPVHDQNPTRRRAWVTYALIAVNIVVFLVSPVGLATLDGTTPVEACATQRFFYEWAAIPAELTRNEPLDRAVGGPVRTDDGRLACALVRPDYRKLPALSALTAMFLHGGWLHLLGNMLFLWIFGNNVEDRMGHVPFLLFYGVCGYAATYGFALLDADSRAPLIGASGAIAGVLGAYLVLYPRARVWVLVPFLIFLPLRLPAWLVLGFWFGLQAVYSSGGAVSDAGTVAYAAHVVGFVVGMLIAWPLRRGTPPPPEPRGLLFGRRARPGW
jgi:membrane associated rhomboid family serine protease